MPSPFPSDAGEIAQTAARPTRAEALASLPIAVIVATKGRPQETGDLLACLERQSAPPAQIILSVTDAADLPEELAPQVDRVVGPAGLCAQRNRGLDLVRSDIEVVAFFDDDYLARADALEQVARLFTDRRGLVAANGRLAADGIHGPGLTRAEAEAVLEESWRGASGEAGHRPAEALYGCNMVFRASALQGLRFDERLPLYGWQEDIDFSAQVGRRGEIIKSDAFVGVHRGVKGARVSGRRFGYSQVINPAYLARKGTMRRLYALKIASKNVLANLAKSARPEPWVDRAGRLHGNLLGFRDLLAGRIDPRRILDV